MLILKEYLFSIFVLTWIVNMILEWSVTTNLILSQTLGVILAGVWIFEEWGKLLQPVARDRFWHGKRWLWLIVMM
jgi:hypothetical protein